MSMQWIMRWGHDFPKDKGVGMLTLSMLGKIHVSRGEPIRTVNCPLSCLSSQPFILLEGGWGSYCLEGEEYGQFRIGQSTQFGRLCFACTNKKTPEPYANFDPRVHVLDLLSRFESWGTFWLIHHIFPIHSPSSFWIMGWHYGISWALPVRILCGTLWYQQSSSCLYPSHYVNVFPSERLWLLCCSVILNYRVYETLLLDSRVRLSCGVSLWLLCCAPWFGSELCTRLRNGRDIECAW